jgi:PadR family transcriptional regulator AphA
MKRQSKSRYAILGLLSMRPMTGYDIKKFTEEVLSHFWRESYGNIYPLLKKLTDEKLVVKKKVPQEGKPDRYVYSLSSRGKSALVSWIYEPCETEFIRSELLLKMFFAADEPIDRTIGHLAKFLTEQKTTLAILTAVDKELNSKTGDEKDTRFWRMTIRRGQYVARARIKWAEECVRDLKAE